MKSTLSGKILVCPQCRESYPRTTGVCPKDGTLLVPPVSDVDALVGKLVDQKYKVIERLGGGGMGVVYKAEHIFMGRTVVLKMLHRHLAEMGNEGEFLKRFQLEARTAAQIEHPNAVTIYDFGVFESQPYLVMQFNRGQTLKALIKAEGFLKPERAIALLSQVGEAVHAAHKLQIIHRDLKPENIMVTKDDNGTERAQVLDFGLAKVIGAMDANTNSMTKTGIVLGTPYYMAPEQAIASNLDARTEVYSLAVILYEALTGSVPFQSESPMEVMLKHIKEKPEPLRTTNPKIVVPDALEEVIAKAMKKEPKNRYDSVPAFMAALKQAIVPPKKPEPAPRVEAAKPAAAPPANPQYVASHRQLERNSDSSAGFERPKRWNPAVLSGIIFLGATMGFALNPVVTYFSPEEMARRAAILEKEQEAATYVKNAKEFVKVGNMKAAIYEYNRALELTPKDVDIYVQLGKNYLEALRYDQALIVLERAVKVEPQNEEVRVLLGTVYQRQGDLDAAVKEFKRVLAFNPKNRAAKKSLQAIQDQNGRSVSARP